jgi:hypothetical protein
MVCILHEWRQLEVDGFKPTYWAGDLFFDPEKTFYAAVHGGQVKKGNLFEFLNPFSRAWKNTKRAKASGTVKDHNLVGDGLTLGGVMVIEKGGKIAYRFEEESFGDHAPFEELLAAARKAGGK